MNTIIGGNYYTGILDDFIIKKDDLNVFKTRLIYKKI